MAGLPCTVYFKWYKEANEVNTTSSLQGDEMVDLVTDLFNERQRDIPVQK